MRVRPTAEALEAASQRQSQEAAGEQRQEWLRMPYTRLQAKIFREKKEFALEKLLQYASVSKDPDIVREFTKYTEAILTLAGLEIKELPNADE